MKILFENELLVNNQTLSLNTLGGRSVLKFTFTNLTIKIENSNKKVSSFSWEDFTEVQNYCESIGYRKVGKYYNPMNKEIDFPIKYPKSRDTLSLAALAHYVVGQHPHI